MSSYQTVYGVGLLDDIHNYFPELLYNSAAFTTVPQVLSYVQAQTRRRFNLFSYGREQYLETPLPTNNMPRVIVPPAPAPAPTFFTMEGAHEYDDIFRLTNQSDRMPNMNLAILATLLQGIPRRQPDANFMEPVIVRPTAEQIATTTTLTTAVADGTCAVCQDDFSGAAERRTLNFCHHTFHRGCIDTWFQTNVHCPVCRHDIRITS
uniref:RING-type domain-containing protein n=1 Tax=viral metagenome TaxID=1070528 RepID=A0A6C0BD67_9ZZZZ